MLGFASPPHRGPLVLAVLGCGAAAALLAAEPRAQTVTIENLQFTPAHLSVHRGDRIVWVNRDLFPHTVTAADRAFDSGSIDAGKSWTYQADKPGEYAYSCTFHPTMTATVTVQ